MAPMIMPIRAWMKARPTSAPMLWSSPACSRSHCTRSFLSSSALVGELPGEPDREVLPGGLDDVGHLADQGGEVPLVAAEEGDDADDGEGQRRDDEHREETHGDELASLAAAADEMQPARQDVDDLVDGEPADQRRQYVEMEDQEEGEAGEDPGGDLGGGGRAADLRCGRVVHGQGSLEPPPIFAQNAGPQRPAIGRVCPIVYESDLALSSGCASISS